MSDIENGMRWREASKKHGVPMGTIGLHLKNPGLRAGAGRSRALSEADEKELANCLRTLAK